MKCITLALFLSFGAIALANQGHWKQGQRYLFDYETKTLTGIPGLKDQVSGDSFKSSVTVEVQSPSELWVKMDRNKIALLENEVLQESQDAWRHPAVQYQDLQSDEGISRPFIVHLENGRVKRISAKGNEPVWVLNMKRGLASQLSLNAEKMRGFPSFNGENEIQKTSFPQQTVSENEESISGNCRTYYTLVPLPEYIASNAERDIPEQYRRDSKAYIVTKTKDFTHCSQKPAFVHSSVVDMSEEGSNPADSTDKRFSSRTSVSRYLIRGNPQQDYQLLKAWTEGEYVVKPFATNTESIFVVSNQTLTFKGQQSGVNVQPPSDVRPRSLLFDMVHLQQDQINSPEYLRQARYEGQSEQFETQQDAEGNQVQVLSQSSPGYPKLKKVPVWYQTSGVLAPVQELKQQIKQLVQETLEQLETLQELDEKEPQMKVVKISQALQHLDYVHIERVYSELLRQGGNPDSIKQIFFDALAIAGTNPAWKFIIDKMQSGELEKQRATQIVMLLPATVKTPTPELLQELVELLGKLNSQSSQEAEKELYSTALMSIASLINRGCLNAKTRRHNWASSPNVNRAYCGPEQAKLLSPTLKEKLQEFQGEENAMKMTSLIQAIGNLGGQRGYEMLKKIVVKEIETSKQARSKAILALGRVAEGASQQLRKKIISLVKPIFSNPAEPTEIRLSGFATGLRAKPEEPFYTEAATSTWMDPTQEYTQFVYKSLEALANCTYPTHANASRMASMALPLAKKIDLGVQYSDNYIHTHVIPERRMGSTFQWVQFSGKQSLIPEQVYMAIKNYMGGFDVPTIEVAFQSQGIQALINRVFGPEMREQLDLDQEISQRKELDTQANLWVRMMGSMERSFSFETLRQWRQQGYITYLGKDNYQYNYHKTIPLLDAIFVFPLESGSHMYVSKKTPLLISVKGDLQVNMEGSKVFNFKKQQFPEVKVKANLKPIVALTHHIEAGIASPVAGKVLVSGHKTSVTKSAPAKVTVEVKPQKQEVKFSVEPADEMPDQVTLFSIKATPYTGHSKFYNVLTKNAKPIQISQQQKVNQQLHTSVAKYAGVYLESKLRMDGETPAFADLFRALQRHDLLTASQYMSVPRSLKGFEYKLKWDVDRSQTKKIKGFLFRESLNSEYRNQIELLNGQTMTLEDKSEVTQETQELREKLQINGQPTTYQLRREAYQQQQQQGAQSISNIERQIAGGQILLEGQQHRDYRFKMYRFRTIDRRYSHLAAIASREGHSSYQPARIYAFAQYVAKEVPSQLDEMIRQPEQMKAATHIGIHYLKGEKAFRLETKMIFKQSDEWNRAVQESSTLRVCRRDSRFRSPYSPACLEARENAQAMNKMEAEFQLDLNQESALPRSLLNATHHIDDLAKYLLYPYMTNNAVEVQNEKQKVKITLNIRPPRSERRYQVLDVYVQKPRENTNFEGIKMNKYSSAVLPLSAGIPVQKKVLNKLMGQEYTPYCEISPNTVRTFDNVSYPYTQSECYQLLAKDCSFQIPVQVLAKNTVEGIKIKLNVGKKEVKIVNGQEILVDGQRIEINEQEHRVIKNEEGRRILELTRWRKQKVIVDAPVHGIKIITDGVNMKIEMSNSFRGRTCGLCGDMNGEKVAEFKDPQGCIRKDPREFARSYIFEGNCAKAEPAKKCVLEYSASWAEHQDENIVPSSQDSYYAESRSSHIHYRNKVVSRQGEICFSVKPIAECRLGTQAVDKINKEIGFHCVRKGRVAREWSVRANHEVLDELLEKTVDFKEYISVPTVCEPIEGY